MGRKRGGVKDSIKVTSKIIEAAELISTAQGMNRQAWDRFWYEVKEKMLFGLAIGALGGLWYLFYLMGW
jgi:hypothetical protein